MITLLHPIWLVLAIPLAISLWIWPQPSKLLQTLRITAIILVVLAMCRLAIRLPSRAGTIVVVADRSLSMPENAATRQKETIDLLQHAMKTDDRLAVVSFGEKPVIDRSPQTGEFSGFIGQVGRDGSDLGKALETAVSLIPPEGGARILVLSDGRWTGKDPAAVAVRAAARGIAIDYRTMERPSANDVAIQSIDAPSNVTPGASFMVTAWVRSPVGQEVSYQLLRGNTRIASGKRTMRTGLNRLTFRDQAADPGAVKYTLTVSSKQNDPIPENNQAKMLVGVEGPKPILCVTPTETSALVTLLKAGRLQIKARQSDQCNWALEDLAAYSAVLIENVPAQKIGVHAMENIAAWVSETGTGLVMTGGRRSYGPGGYFRSPLEPIMPVSMELRAEHRKFKLAIVVAVDRSGSMAVSVGGGKTKMDLANLATAEVLDMLSDMDEFGVIAIDSSPHVIADLRTVDQNRQLRSKILRTQSMGGGIFVYTALKAAAEMLMSAEAGTRHIILFSDAQDSEEPGKYRELLAECRKADITVSVIGLGSRSDRDADFLVDIAKRGDGRCFFTTDATELPRLFAQDTFVVARSTFIDEPTPFKTTGAMISLTGQSFKNPPNLGGYNLCYIRPKANLAAITTDEYAAPVVAAWQAGSGRVVAYTGEADGKFTGPVANWDKVGDFLASQARWAAGDAESLPENMLLTQNVEKGICYVTLHLDPERESTPFTTLPKITILRAIPGQKPAVTKSTLQWTSADTLAVEVPLHGDQTVLSKVDIASIGKRTLPPVCLPYSPEFKPTDGDQAILQLETLARTTGGKERIDLAAAWHDLPRTPRFIEIGRYMLLVAIVILLVEILERRTGLLSMLPGKKRKAQEEPPSEAPEKPGRKARTIPDKEQPTKPTPQGDQDHDNMLDAFQQARRKAKDRTR